jgi:hypothetical protein
METWPGIIASPAHPPPITRSSSHVSRHLLESPEHILDGVVIMVESRRYCGDTVLGYGKTQLEPVFSISGVIAGSAIVSQVIKRIDLE